MGGGVWESAALGGLPLIDAFASSLLEWTRAQLGNHAGMSVAVRVGGVGGWVVLLGGVAAHQALPRIEAFARALLE